MKENEIWSTKDIKPKMNKLNKLIEEHNKSCVSKKVVAKAFGVDFSDVLKIFNELEKEQKNAPKIDSDDIIATVVFKSPGACSDSNEKLVRSFLTKEGQKLVKYISAKQGISIQRKVKR